MSSSITINSNLASLNAQRRLGQSTSALQTSFTRLSSGLRINKASDDAAGLAISESLNVDARVFGQGIRNLNDGLSTLAVADAAVEELSSIVIRLQELAEQAANGTLGHEQRAALDEEAQTLKDEYFRIAQSTEFNGRYLLRGDFGELSLQGGYGEEGGITSGFGGAVGDGTFQVMASFPVGDQPRFVAVGDFNNDFIADLVSPNQGDDAVSVLLGKGDGTFGGAGSFAVEDEPTYVAVGDFNGDGISDLAAADYGGESLSILLGVGDGSFSASKSYKVGRLKPASIAIGDFNGDSIQDLATAEYWGETSVLLGNGNGTFKSATSYETFPAPFSVATGDLNGDGVLDLVSGAGWADVFLGNGDGSFAAATSFVISAASDFVTTDDFNGDGILDLLTGGNEISILLGNGNGSFKARSTFGAGGYSHSLTTGDFNGDGTLDLVSANTTDKTADIYLGVGDGSFTLGTTHGVGSFTENFASGDFNGDGVQDLIGAGRFSDTARVLLGNAVDGVGPLPEFSLTTQADARQALPVFQRKLDQLSAQRGEIGAFQARVEVAINKMQVEKENYTAARSQITDADVAWESAKLIRNNILQQAGAAVLAQANQAPALALALLQ